MIVIIITQRHDYNGQSVVDGGCSSGSIALGRQRSDKFFIFVGKIIFFVVIISSIMFS